MNHVKLCSDLSLPYHCPHPECNCKFRYLTHSLSHEHEIPGIDMTIKELSFADKLSFQLWLEHEGTKTFTSFKKDTGSKRNDINIYSYYSCQFSKNEASETYKRKTSRRNIKGSIPPIECPARIVVCENGEGISAKYFSKHSHELCPQNIKFQPIKKTCREFIKANCWVTSKKLNKTSLSNLKDLTPASQRPPKFGALGGGISNLFLQRPYNLQVPQQFLTTHSERSTWPATRRVDQPAVFIPMIRPLSNSLNYEKCPLARLPGMFRLPKSSYNRRVIVTFMNLQQHYLKGTGIWSDSSVPYLA
ncbi:uncharacterized protein TNCV_2068491 [Trichonephila clavipes]|uniref:Uncharacterized protein n=1 Tax=Trichonephila clavipes TaxID=2585209 RepID=A0A8X7BDA3_TRICX|nr:uncharacterized protein TNCV_2068491 [Trichonephila clavipes]